MRFAGLALAGAVVLLWFPGAEAAYTSGIRAVTNAAFAWVEPPHTLRLTGVNPESRRDRSDTRLHGGIGGLRAGGDRRTQQPSTTRWSGAVVVCAPHADEGGQRRPRTVVAVSAQ